MDFWNFRAEMGSVGLIVKSNFQHGNRLLEHQILFIWNSTLTENVRAGVKTIQRDIKPNFRPKFWDLKLQTLIYPKLKRSPCHKNDPFGLESVVPIVEAMLKPKAWIFKVLNLIYLQFVGPIGKTDFRPGSQLLKVLYFVLFGNEKLILPKMIEPGCNAVERIPNQTLDAKHDFWKFQIWFS